MSTEVVIYIEDTTKRLQGEKLARSLHLPIVDIDSENQIILALTRERLELRIPHMKVKPLYVDFLSLAAKMRRTKSFGRSEIIARAVGIKGSFSPTVLDATAGLGTDAMLLAHLGCKVVMLERSPVIFALLADGLNRAAAELPDLVKNISLQWMDSLTFLQTTKESFDVIYLDPMFPKRLKSSLVKKEMRLLKEIVGSDEDAGQLFAVAKQHARRRVVVKRPRYSPSLTDEPDVVFKARASRFDVYLVR